MRWVDPAAVGSARPAPCPPPRARCSRTRRPTPSRTRASPSSAVRAGRDEDWSSRRCISPESMLKLAEPAGPEPVESEASRRRGLMIVEPAMGVAGTGRRAA